MVATATVFIEDDRMPLIIHGHVLSREDYVRVSIDSVYRGYENVESPFPTDGLRHIGELSGFILAWPRICVRPPGYAPQVLIFIILWFKVIIRVLRPMIYLTNRV